ncbi:MAG: hypothetical protein M1135_01915 [Candidatus Omnitrophica bacterium]|nr:hypothetical protein [Candidatus Omnitrophota bacterium]
MKDIKNFKNLIIYIIYVLIISLSIKINYVFPAVNLTSYIMPYIKEKVVTIENMKNFPTNWKLTTGVIAEEKQNFGLNGSGYTLKINYNFKTAREKQINFYYYLPKNHFIGETLMFWLKGDDSLNTLHVACFYRKHWVDLTSGYQSSFPILLKKGWQHIEIPASNPLYRFYDDVTTFRFTIIKQGNKKSGSFILGDLKFTKPLSVVNVNFSNQMWKNKKIISPAFDTWGSPPPSEFKIGKKIGINISIVDVISLFNNCKPSPLQLESGMKEVISADKAGILGGIDIGGVGASSKFLRKHSGWLMKDEKGQLSYLSVADGFPLSPWNPKVREILKEYIIRALNFYKKKGNLKYIKVVKIAPGTESEVSYEWDHVWAFDRYAIKSYHRYLKYMYNNKIKNLNNDWGTNYVDFNQILPPHSWYPDRRHWVFYNFYRWSMLKWCVRLADDVRIVYKPKYWLWLTHSVPSYPWRFHSARDPLFYGENLARLGIINYAHLVSGWQTKDDIGYVKKLEIIPIAEMDVVPTISVQKATFKEAQKQGFDGVFIGVMEVEVNPLKEKPTKLGKITEQLIKKFSNK